MIDAKTALGFSVLVLAAFGSWYLASVNGVDEEVATPAESVTRG